MKISSYGLDVRARAVILDRLKEHFNRHQLPLYNKNNVLVYVSSQDAFAFELTDSGLEVYMQKFNGAFTDTIISEIEKIVKDTRLNESIFDY